MAGTLAVGFFDGVHLGHRAILSGADEALTFGNHPLSVLAPDRAPRLIMSLGDRVAAIRACGVGRVTVLDFTREFASLEPGEFAAAYLAGRRIRCGSNWRFGKDGRGDAAFLRASGYDVTVVPPVAFAASSSREEAISSTRIRAALEDGRIAEANAMLGRVFRVHGLPFKGKGEGRSIGCPTVNLRLSGLSLALPLGVYAAEVDGARGIANYGRAPTFGERAWDEPVLEIHFTDALPEGLESGGRVTVGLRAFIRREMRFETPDGLRAQIAADLEAMVRCGRGR